MPRMPASVLRARRKAREERKKKAAASKRDRRHYVTRRREEYLAKKAAAKKAAAKKAAAKRPAAKKAAARRSPDQVLADSRRNSAQRKATAARSRAVIDAGINASPPVGSAPVDRVKTKGGEYKVYKEKSEAAKSFRRAFLDAKALGQKTFTWDGRRYTTKTK